MGLHFRQKSKPTCLDFVAMTIESTWGKPRGEMNEEKNAALYTFAEWIISLQ